LFPVQKSHFGPILLFPGPSIFVFLRATYTMLAGPNPLPVEALLSLSSCSWTDRFSWPNSEVAAPLLPLSSLGSWAFFFFDASRLGTAVVSAHVQTHINLKHAHHTHTTCTQTNLQLHSAYIVSFVRSPSPSMAP
jgi:hypothetical protein